MVSSVYRLFLFFPTKILRSCKVYFSCKKHKIPWGHQLKVQKHRGDLRREKIWGECESKLTWVVGMLGMWACSNVRGPDLVQAVSQILWFFLRNVWLLGWNHTKVDSTRLGFFLSSMTKEQESWKCLQVDVYMMDFEKSCGSWIGSLGKVKNYVGGLL